MSDEKKVVVDLEKCMRPIKQKAYSTMCNMRKQDLIDYIRELEHNYNVAIAYNEQQAQNVETLLKEQEEKKPLGLQLPKEERGCGTKGQVTALDDWRIRRCGNDWKYCNGDCGPCRRTRGIFTLTLQRCLTANA